MMDDATFAQVVAANPRNSTWLSANAGSGKTRVLTNRVARLLLQGCDPRNILCLTYTKAAASEMQNRLFQTLGDWAMRSDAELREALEEMGETPPEDLSRARTLFARAIEVPGGLRIQTIHALCASILRQFPLEGGVSPQFREMDDASRNALIEGVLDNLAVKRPAVLSEVSVFYSDENLVGLGRMVSSRADDFVITRSHGDIYRKFGVPENLTMEAILESVFLPGDLEMVREIAIALAQGGSSNDVKDSGKLADLPDKPTLAALEILEDVFLFKSGASASCARIGKFPTKTGAALPEVAIRLPQLHDLMQRVEDARRDRIAMVAAEKTAAIHQFAQAFLPAYEKAKQDRGVLDFDDLIRRTRDMLDGPALRWVLYRLDGQIDHILVDEAQDTSPAQWAIIRSLTDAMIDDDGRERTLFVVGDKKQSIYSFQGADAEGFDTKAGEFNQQLAGTLHSRELLHSFRSSSAILSLVDKVCEGLDGVGEGVRHVAFHGDKPGRVDLLPLIPPPDDADEPAWYDPVDRPVDNAASVQLGKEVAKIIRQLLETETIKGKDGEIRRIEAGDIMILVQKRSAIFDQIIQACKAAELPIAGSDRLRIGAELAVRDLLALLSFLTLPEDDLSLAAVLRSPLFGWSERELYDLANVRTEKTIWAEIRRRGAEFPETFAILDKLRRKVDYLLPYEMLELILGEYRGREKLLARLGPEAEDGIDELLNQALIFEREEVPSITAFLTRVSSDDIEIKRDADSADHLIQVMTVHGAKGLERPIVILPDTTTERKEGRSGILRDEDGMPLLSLSKSESPAIVQDAKDERKRIESEERNRLLYVAMTRAESWLIVGGAGLKRGSKTEMNWHQTIQDGMERAGAGPSPLDPQGLRLEHGDWPEALEPRDLSGDTGHNVGPDFLKNAAPLPIQTPMPVSPSDLGGSKVLGGGALAEDEAKRRGRQIHLLLEHLPGQRDPESVARRLLSHGADRADESEVPELFNQAMRNLTLHPGIFGADALAEVDVSAHLPTLDARMSGTIDRLIVTPDKVQAIDFKTNSIVPERPEDTPDGLLFQMGAYLEALESIYPDRAIEVAILWTETCELMVLPHAIVRAALPNATIS